MGKHGKYKKVYTTSWETLPLFQGWLMRDPQDNDRAYCKCCKISLRAHKTDLETHSKRPKHKENFKKLIPPKTQQKINNVLVIRDETKEAELILAAFTATHTSIKTIDHLTPVIKRVNKTDDNIKSIQLHRTKCTMIIKNVIAKSITEDIVRDIGDQYYSLIIDESTDISVLKYLCMCVRYFSLKQGTIVTQFLGLIDIRSGEAVYLTELIKTHLRGLGLNLYKMIGLGTDGASNLCGVNHSVFTLLREDIPNLQLVKCIAHSLHLCCKHASSTLPPEIDFICKQVYNWFSDSSNRRHEYKELFDVINGNEKVTFHKFVKLSETRWLERANVLKVILEQWCEIKAYFNVVLKKQSDCIPRLLAGYLNDKHHLIIIVLYDLLLEVNKINLLFQHDNADIFKIYCDLYQLLLTLLQKIIKPIFLENITQMTENNFKKILDILDNKLALIPINLLDFGYKFRECVSSSNIDKESILGIKKICGEFIWRLCREIAQRIPMNLHVYNALKYFHPDNCLKQNSRAKFSELPLNILENNDNRNLLEQQWNKLILIDWKLQENVNTEMFWKDVYNYTNAGGEYIFREIANFAIKALSLPLSNATVERVFSTMNLIKTKVRNKLNLPLLCSLLTIKTHFNITKTCCQEFQPSQEMFKQFNVNMYDHKNNQNVNDETENIEITETIEIFDEFSYL